ncbi:MAG: hypothetical protein WKG06_08665 [Segetibacter sp.]
MDRLQNRFGLNVQQAANIANNLIPTVLKKLVQKTADPAITALYFPPFNIMQCSLN